MADASPDEVRLGLRLLGQYLAAARRHVPSGEPAVESAIRMAAASLPAAKIRERVQEIAAQNAARLAEDLRAARRRHARESRRLLPHVARRLAEIRAFTLVLHPERMLGMPRDVAVLLGGLPNVRLVAVAGTTPFLNLEAPEAFNRAVLHFLDGIYRDTAQP